MIVMTETEWADTMDNAVGNTSVIKSQYDGLLKQTKTKQFRASIDKAS